MMNLEIDLDACRENLRKREEQAFLEREERRQTARAEILAAVQTVLPDHPTVQRLYLFGSVTRKGAFQLDSDIDIAVEGPNAKEYFALWRDLEAAASNWTIDLRDIHELSYFTQSVRQRGELLYERKDPGFEGGHRSGSGSDCSDLREASRIQHIEES